jgi:hypothetical protein
MKYLYNEIFILILINSCKISSFFPFNPIFKSLFILKILNIKFDRYFRIIYRQNKGFIKF